MQRSVLHKKNILITRNINELQTEEKIISKLGGKLIGYEAIKISLTENYSLLKEYLSVADFINFSSVNAVKYFVENIKDSLSIPKNIKIIAVGEKTSQLCKSYGFDCEKLPDEFSAKGLIELYKDLNCSGKNILIPSSSKARSELADGLKELGANVFPVEVYTVKTNFDEINNLNFKKSGKEIDVFCFTSPSNFNAFLEINKINDPVKYFNSKIIAAIGTTSQKSIEKKNLNVNIVPRRFTISDMVNSIIEYFENEVIN